MKMKTKRKLIRLLSSLMIVFSIVNLVEIVLGIGSKIYAAEFSMTGIVANLGLTAGLGVIMAGLPLIILNVLKLLIIVLGLVIHGLISGIQLSLDGFDGIGLKSILFAGIEGSSKFLDVNFFDLTVNGTLLSFRTAVAKWYYILRLISAAILLVILIYVGIKMAISTIASEQAKYKQMLVDWVTSLALLFLLHYIIIFIITINSTLVQALDYTQDDCTKNMLLTLVSKFWHPGLDGFLASIVYLVFVGQIFSFFLLYMKRMITIGFLIMISPLITITYAIDKMGDGKAQALNAWLKELSYNILIQPFHCVIFMAFFDAIANMISGANSWNPGAYIFAIMIMQFMKKAEEILRKIFHFEASSMSSLSESGQNIANSTGKFVKVGMAAGGALATFKAAGGFKAAKENWQQLKANRQIDRNANRLVKAHYEKEKEKGNASTESFREFKKTEEYQKQLSTAKRVTAANMKQEATRKALREREEKINKNREKYDKKHGTGAYDAMIERRAEKAYDKEHGAGTYQLLKNVASQTTRRGQPTASAKKAQGKLNEAQARAHNSVIEEGGVGARRTLKNTWKNTGGKAFSNMRKFADSDYGKLLGAGLKDSTKIAAAIGMGAFALGATGELNDAISLGQTGYGFAKGFLQNSTKTVTKDSSEKIEQLASLLVDNPQDLQKLLADPQEIQKLLQSITADKNAGALDTKSISNQLDKLKDTIASLFADVKEADRESSLFVNAIRSASVKGELSYDKIEQLINQQFDNIDEADRDDITVQANAYAQIILKAGIANNGTTLEGAGVDVDEHDYKVAQRVSNKYSNG